MTYQVQLDVFEGPLDLLLYLIKEEELNIYDIEINKITEQYSTYLNLMELLDLNIAGEFLVMAATLMQIKSRMLLPIEEADETQEESLDPRADLVQRLLEYKKFKEAALRLQGCEQERNSYVTRYPQEIEMDGGDNTFFEASLFDLIAAFSKVLKGISREAFHQVIKDEFTVAQKVHELFHILLKKERVFFSQLFKNAQSKIEIITIFLALLELIRLKEVAIFQNKSFEDIEIRKNSENMIAPKLTGATYDEPLKQEPTQA